MAAKFRGTRQAIDNTAKIIGEIQAVQIVRALKSAMYIIRTESATMTPIETSVLINSQFDVIETNGTRITGKVGYSANYAIYVHNSKGKLLGTNTPRASGKGVVWGPHGEPKFLEKAIIKTRGLVESAIRREMKLK